MRKQEEGRHAAIIVGYTRIRTQAQGYAALARAILKQAYYDARGYERKNSYADFSISNVKEDAHCFMNVRSGETSEWREMLQALAQGE